MRAARGTGCGLREKRTSILRCKAPVPHRVTRAPKNNRPDAGKRFSRHDNSGNFFARVNLCFI